jgi:hypothetical protein
MSNLKERINENVNVPQGEADVCGSTITTQVDDSGNRILWDRAGKHPE